MAASKSGTGNIFYTSSEDVSIRKVATGSQAPAVACDGEFPSVPGIIASALLSKTANLPEAVFLNTYTISIAGSANGTTYALTAGKLPGGLFLDAATGKISTTQNGNSFYLVATSPEEGTAGNLYTFTITASSKGKSESNTYSLPVKGRNLGKTTPLTCGAVKIGAGSTPTISFTYTPGTGAYGYTANGFQVFIDGKSKGSYAAIRNVAPDVNAISEVGTHIISVAPTAAHLDDCYGEAGTITVTTAAGALPGMTTWKCSQ